MLTLPTVIMVLLEPFRPVFQRSTWNKVQVLLVGSILAPGKRTVTSVLRAVGLADEPGFSKYHQVLNRAVWSSRQASQVLLRLLLTMLNDGRGLLVFGIDETIERRWGPKIKARGIYRDAVRSSQSHFVKTSGLRWISLMWLTEIPWAQRIWALPFLTVLAPSERYCKQSKRHHKTLTDWARQMIYQLRRWLPQCELVVVGDNSYAAIDLLHACQKLTNPVTMIARLRLDAALYEPAPPYSGRGRPRQKAGALWARLPSLAALLTAETTTWIEQSVIWYQGSVRPMEIATGSALWHRAGKPVVPLRWLLIRDPHGRFDPLALLCTNLTYSPEQILQWFVRRWSMEVTFEESRAHLGVETQRQWSDLAILRTTPALLGLFSWVTLVAHAMYHTQPPPTQQAAWYAKPLPTFADALASVRHSLWFHPLFSCLSPATSDVVKVPRPLFDRLVNSLCYAT